MGNNINPIVFQLSLSNLSLYSLLQLVGQRARIQLAVSWSNRLVVSLLVHARSLLDQFRENQSYCTGLGLFQSSIDNVLWSSKPTLGTHHKLMCSLMPPTPQSNIGKWISLLDSTQMVSSQSYPQILDQGGNAILRSIIDICSQATF